MIHAFASRPHYLRHLRPVLDALGDDVDLVAKAGQLPRDDSPLLIAGAPDLDVCGRHPVALLEHGAGQRYQGLTHRSWGGLGLDRVGLFLVPRAGVQPEDRSVVVGCPALDRHTDMKVHTGPPVVAFTFHWDAPAARQIPELRSAFPHYRDALGGIVAELRAAGCEVVGHSHPRFRALLRWWRKHGVTVEEDWDAVLSSADVLVADNTSALPEAAAVGLGTVWLRSPEWRPTVIHGGRFYEWERFGIPCSGPDEVLAAVLHEAGRERDPQAARDAVYAGAWGNGAQLAADAVREWATDLRPG